MQHAASMIELAQEEVLIAGWFLTPELFLKRWPGGGGERDPWMLRNLLRRKAEQGVRVFVLLYQEFAQLLDNGSAYAQRALMDLHPRIAVARHPSQAPVPTVWAHHEKLLVVDQMVGFVGGIDLCFGRWDDHLHRWVGAALLLLRAERCRAG